MKKFILFALCISIFGISAGQTKSELRAENLMLKNELQAYAESIRQLQLTNDSLRQQINSIKTFIENLPVISDVEIEERTDYDYSDYQDNSVTSTSTTTHQCIATTQAGTRCSRQAQPGSAYCWQHKNNSTSSSHSSSSGRTYYTGPRGGVYYINSKGNKVYVKRK